ncbi:hypothetical protein vseg_008618 [Gypsophila vaccaria]
MASTEAEKRGVEADSISSENQHENPPPENTNTDSQMSVKVENPPPATESTVAQNKPGCFLTYFEKVPKPFRFLFYFAVFVCLTPVFYACVTAATFTILPLILGAFVVLRLFQFVIRCEVFTKHVELKVLMRYWIFVVVLLILLEVGIFYPVAKYVPEVKLVMIVGLPITKWIIIICKLIGIYLINLVSWTLVGVALAALFTDKNDGSWELVLECISEIFGCLLFLWAEFVVMSSVPTFKESKIFGVYTRKWIKVSLFVLIGYNIISVLTNVLVWTLPKLSGDHRRIGDKLSKALDIACCNDLGKGAFNKKYAAFIGIGMKRSIIFILSAVMLLVTWVLYFDDHLNTPENKRILKFGTWTLLSLLICSFFWLIKSCILLYWEAHAVSNRLHSKITDIGKQLYFLVLLSNVHYKRVFETNASSEKPSERLSYWVLLDSKTEDEEEEDVYVYDISDRRSVREKLIIRTDKKASIYNIQQAAKQILTAGYSLSKESIFSDLGHLQSGNTERDDEDVTEILYKIVHGEIYSNADWTMLRKLLHGGNPGDVISFREVKTWMERAHSRCRFLANTLISENEVTKCLNQVISGVILGATFIMWLLITGLAKTNVLVLIASPLLAATFIFGDTCKSLFQGLVFVYIVHPFDVGDLCFVDNSLLEVKTIGVWSTTFSKVRTTGKQQEVIYPNSILATKNVINYKTEFDWNDKLEFTLSFPDEQTSKNLKGKIEEYLDRTKKDEFAPHFHSVEFLEIGDTAKVAIHIKHKIKTEGWTNFECLKEKEKRRFAFAVYIQDFISSQKPKATPENSADNGEVSGGQGGR